MMEMKVFQEMPYERPDLETYAQAIRQATAAMKDAKTYEEARQAYFDLQAAGEQVETMFSLAHVRNTIDTQDAYYEGEIKWLRENNARMIPLEKAYHEAFATCAFRADFEQEFGEQLLKDVDASLKTSDERLIEDTIRLGELSQEYQKVSAMAETELVCGTMPRLFISSMLMRMPSSTAASAIITSNAIQTVEGVFPNFSIASCAQVGVVSTTASAAASTPSATSSANAEFQSSNINRSSFFFFPKEKPAITRGKRTKYPMPLPYGRMTYTGSKGQTEIFSAAYAAPPAVDAELLYVVKG